jgi:hypothetical protein
VLAILQDAYILLFLSVLIYQKEKKFEKKNMNKNSL